MSVVAPINHGSAPIELRSPTQSKSFLQSATDAIYRHRNDISLSLLALGFDVALGGMSVTIANTAALFLSRIALPFSLLAAVRCKSGTTISSLLKIGVDPNAGFRTTSLIHACETGDKALVQRLLAANADVNRKRSTGFLGSPLHAAVNHPEIVQLLIDAGADVTAVDKYGLTPLHYAAGSQLNEAARILIRAGANPFTPSNVKSAVSGSPFWLARENHEMIRILLGIEGMESFKFCKDLDSIMDVLFTRRLDIKELPVHLIPTIETIRPFVDEGEVRFDAELFKIANENPSLENILNLLKSHNLFCQSWASLNQPKEVIVRFVPKGGGVDKFRACYRPETHEILIDEAISPYEKISCFVFESMNALQRASAVTLYELAARGAIDRETYAILTERIEHNSTEWSEKVLMSMDGRPRIQMDFETTLRALDDTSSPSYRGHTEFYRKEWNRIHSYDFFLNNPAFIEKRKVELLEAEKAQKEEADRWLKEFNRFRGQEEDQQVQQAVQESPQLSEDELSQIFRDVIADITD
jgi:hypothetical protein